MFILMNTKVLKLPLVKIPSEEGNTSVMSCYEVDLYVEHGLKTELRFSVLQQCRHWCPFLKYEPFKIRTSITSLR
jgi:hypothetical protein